MAELEALQRAHESIREAGARLVAISPERPELSQEVIESRKLDFDILHDPGNQFAEKLGLRHVLPEDLRSVYSQFGIVLPETGSDDSWSLPLPARYVFDSDGTIQYAAVHADYRKRPEPDETVEVIEQMTS